MLCFYSISLFFSFHLSIKPLAVFLLNTLIFPYVVLSSTSSLTSLSHKGVSHFDFPCLTLSLIHSLAMSAALSPVSVVCERISIAVTKSSATTPTHCLQPVYTNTTGTSNTSTYVCVLTETNASCSSCTTLSFELTEMDGQHSSVVCGLQASLMLSLDNFDELTDILFFLFTPFFPCKTYLRRDKTRQN